MCIVITEADVTEERTDDEIANATNDNATTESVVANSKERTMIDETTNDTTVITECGTVAEDCMNDETPANATNDSATTESVVDTSKERTI